MSARWQTIRRALLGVLLVLVLGGPTPGSVGDCTTSANVADPVQFCIDRKTWSCERRGARGELNEAEVDACLAPIVDDCSGTTWPSDCTPPTDLEAQACINAMADISRLSTPENELVECQLSTLCGGGR